MQPIARRSFLFGVGAVSALPATAAFAVNALPDARFVGFAQEFNVLFLSLPFRIVTGIFVMGLSILLGGGALQSMAQEMLSIVARFLAS